MQIENLQLDIHQCTRIYSKINSMHLFVWAGHWLHGVMSDWKSLCDIYNLLLDRKHFAETECFFSICEEKLIKLNWNKMNSAGINK